MSVRKIVNKSPAIVLFMVVVALAASAWTLWSQNSQAGAPKPPTVGYFTVDDGKTWFVDDLHKLPPFEKDGKEAVRAHIFTCGNTRICGYLERYTERAKILIEEGRRRPIVPGHPQAPNGELVAMAQGALEVKRPGDETWENMNEGGARATAVSCPGGEEPVRFIP